jgi:glycosyltransferase involved in cell wall biosynthesis
MARIDIFISAYERPEWTTRAVSSILGQTFTELSLTVSDDSASDAVRSAVEQFMKDKRFRYVAHTPRVGMAGNWNDCILMSESEFVAVFHDDDIYEPSMVQRAIAFLDSQQNVVFVHTAGVYIDEMEREVGPARQPWAPITSGSEFRSRLIRSQTSGVICPSVVTRRRAYELVGLFLERPGAGNDKEMWLRLAQLGDVGYIDEPLIRNRIRTGARHEKDLASGWSVDTTYLLLEIARLAPLAYGDSIAGRLHGEWDFLRLRNQMPLSTIAFLVVHGQNELAQRARRELAGFMSPPVGRLADALLANDVAGSMLRKRLKQLARLRRRWRAGKVRTSNRTGDA